MITFLTSVLFDLLVINIRVSFFFFMKFIFGNHFQQRYDFLSDGYGSSNVYLFRYIPLLSFRNALKLPCFLHRHLVKKAGGGGEKS